MDDQMITGIASAVGVSIGLVIHQMLQSRRNKALGEKIERVLREQGERTLPELAQALDMGSFFARGKVFNALTDMVNRGLIEAIPAPEGTPQLKKVNFIKYRLLGPGGSAPSG